MCTRIVCHRVLVLIPVTKAGIVQHLVWSGLCNVQFHAFVRAHVRAYVRYIDRCVRVQTICVCVHACVRACVRARACVRVCAMFTHQAFTDRKLA